MRVLVTGASGFIGQRLVQLLMERGDTVHALCRSRLCSNTTTQHVVVFSGDILDRASIERAMMGCDRVFHVAGYAKNWARDPYDFYDVNVQGTTNVLQAARTLGVRKVVYTSSVMTLGPSNGVPVDESSSRTAPLLTHYESSKLGAEHVVLDVVKRGLDAVIVNPTRVFGPGLLTEGNSLTRMIKLYIEGKWRFIPGDGRALGNYAFVDDVAIGHMLAMDRGTPGTRYILGGENISYNALFDMIARISARHHRLLHIPGTVAIAASHAEEWRARWFHGYPAISPGWTKTFLRDCAYCSARAEHEFGYHITPLEEAMEKTVRWLVGRQNPSTRSERK